MITFLLCILVIVVIGTVISYQSPFRRYNKENKEEEFTGFGKMNKYDAYQKCVKIINSCKTYQQWLRAMEMSRLHYQLYEDSFLEGALSTEWNYAEPDDMEVKEKDSI